MKFTLSDSVVEQVLKLEAIRVADSVMSSILREIRELRNQPLL